MENYVSVRKLSAMPYAQAHVEIDAYGNIYLYSYVTLVAGITADGVAWCNGLYSMTTRRHISAFAKEYAGLDYYCFKSMVENGYSIDLNTGEILYDEIEEENSEMVN